MQQQKTFAAGRRSVALIQSGDAIDRDREQGCVAVLLFAVGIAPIGQQRKMQIALGAGKVMDFQPFDIFLDRASCRQHGRDRDQRPQMRGHAVAKLQRRQQCRAESPR